MIITVTGHRPNKLGNAYDVKHPTNIAIGKQMRAFILEKAEFDTETNTFRDEDAVTLISGMALGVDTLWALVALRLKRDFPTKFTLECAIPCQNHSSRWIKESKDLYDDILARADKVTLVSDAPYNASLMQKRNEYMVDNADMVFAVWDGTKGGTGNCVSYAVKQQKTVYVLHPFELDLKTYGQ